MIIINENRMIFPFLSKNNDINFFEKIVRINKKNQQVFPWKNFQIKPHEIRGELREFNKIENKNIIFSSYRLDKNCYSLYSVDYKKIYLIPHNNLDSIEFSILDICVHLFNSGISFLELKYKNNSTNEFDLLNMNYYLSELKSNIELDIVRLIWNPETNMKEEEIERITVPNFLKRILSDFSKIYDIDFNENMNSNSSKPILFSYCLLDKDNTDVAKHLGLNMKMSYKINEDVLIQTKSFENSSWIYSLNSIVNVSFLSEDDLTNNFFKTTFIDKINNLYYFLFLQVAHQRLFLQLCHYKIKSYNFDVTNFEENKKLIDDLSGFSAYFNKLCIRYFFDKPSSIDHINTFYSTLRSCFDVLDHFELVKSDLNVMMDYVNKKYLLHDDYNKLVAEIKKCKFDLITYLVASIITFVSVYDTFLKMLNIFEVDLKIAAHIVFAVLFVLICFIVPTAINVYYNIRKLKRLNEKVKHMKCNIVNDQRINLF